MTTETSLNFVIPINCVKCQNKLNIFLNKDGTIKEVQQTIIDRQAVTLE